MTRPEIPSPEIPMPETPPPEMMPADPSRPVLLLNGPVMEDAVERPLAARFTLLPRARLDDLDAATAASVQGIVTRGWTRVDAALMDRLPGLRIIACFGVGYDQVDAAEAARRGIMVTHTPGVLDEEVADLTLGLLLATVREIPQADRFVRAGRWQKGAYPLSASLRGRTVGLVGLGRIGLAVARRLDAFAVPVIYHSRRPRPEVPYAHYPDLLALARAADVLVVIVPGGPATRNLVNAEVLAALGPQGILINVARGSVVDEEALLEALRTGVIGAAGLDVYAHEPQVPEGFLALDNVVLLPHVGSATRATRAAMGRLVVDNLFSWFAGHGPLTPVPETPWPDGAPSAIS